jgi:import receptor subunit TOM70
MPPPPVQASQVPLSSYTSIPTSTPPPTITSGPPSTLFVRTQKWIEDNQRLLILGAAVAVVSGAGYLLYTKPSQKPSTPGSGEKATGEKKKKKKKSGSSGLKDGFLRNEGEDGPLLEEIKPEESTEAPVVPAVPDHLEGESIHFKRNVNRYLSGM